MTRLGTLLAGVGLIIASGAIASVQADDDRESATLFTLRLSGDHFVCGAVNVGHRTLRIDFAILGVDGQRLPAVAGKDSKPNPNFLFGPGTRDANDFGVGLRMPPADRI